MHQIIEHARHESQPSDEEFDPACPPLEPALLARHKPRSYFHLLRDKRIVARCSIWTDSTPSLDSQPVGVIGHYAAADLDAGAAILNHATEQLCRHGFKTVVGPMDGNTWRRYRLLAQRGAEPPFFLEPDNPDDWPGHFTAAGFTPLAQYFSALNRDLQASDPRAAEVMTRLAEAGVRIRNIDMTRFDDELKAVHELSLQAFAGNFLYTPITQVEFLAMYAPIRPHLRPELILLAEKDSRLIGFIFGMPDLIQAQRGQSIDTAIAKSMAVRPGSTGGGLGTVLMDQFHQAARGLGFTRVIHALMHEDNRSLKISSHFGQPIRQYTLYAREL
jgi:GNAT superfamily N-acetyltransferase